MLKNRRYPYSSNFLKHELSLMRHDRDYLIKKVKMFILILCLTILFVIVIYLVTNSISC